MKLFYSVAFLLLSGVIAGQVLAYSNPIEYVQNKPTEITLIESSAEDIYVQYHDLAVQVAVAHGIDIQLFTSVIACESNFNPTIQSNHIYNFNDPARGIVAGERELSYGIAQFHIPDWDITIEQAQDPVFALNKMAQLWLEGKAELWTCYRNIVDN